MKALGWLLDLHAAAKNIYDGLFFEMDKEVKGKTGPQKSIFRDIGYPNVHDLVGHHAGHTAPAYGAMSSYGAVDSSKVPHQWRAQTFTSMLIRPFAGE